MLSDSLKKNLRKELVLFLVLTLFGVLVLPLLVYLVGQLVFGAYEQGGFGTFYGTLHGRFRAGEGAVWFLLFSPYIVWQLLRVTVRGFRAAGRLGQGVRN